MAKPEGSIFGTLAVAAVIAVGGAWLLATVYEATRGPIATEQRAELVARLNSVLDPALRGHDLETVRLEVADEGLLGSAALLDAFVIRDGATPAAVVLSAVAPHGYNASITLLLGVSPAGTVTGVRVVRHRETKGLGDAVDSAKSDWITQFDGRSLANLAPELWAVRQDDGNLDAISGATVTSRAVIGAVKNALLYFERHSGELYAAAAAETADERTE